MRNRLPITFPTPVVTLLAALEQAGFEAYAVGGCIRDSLLGKMPADWDICTDALPEQICACFIGYPLVHTGMRHGTVTVIMDGQPFEITTYRVDGLYSDHRRPDCVHFSASLYADLARRDLTINAMAYHPQKGLVDVYNGETDLRTGVIRCVGEADKRFKEDALRILRALRFAAVYGFAVDSQTAYALHSNVPLLARVSVERVSSELCRLLTGGAAHNVLYAYPDVIGEAIPGLADRMRQPDFPTRWKQVTDVIAQAAQNLPIALSELAILSVKTKCITDVKLRHEVSKWCNVIRLDRHTAGLVALLASNRTVPSIVDDIVLKRMMYRFEAPQTALLLTAWHARMLAEGDTIAADRMQLAQERMEQLLEEKVCYNLKGLAVNGNDLKRMGVNDGKTIGELLNKLVTAVINGQVENQKALLLEQIKRDKTKIL